MRTTSTTAKRRAPGQATREVWVEPPERNNTDNGRLVTEEVIRLRAYMKWEAAGKPPGNGVNFWVEAERELLHPVWSFPTV